MATRKTRRGQSRTARQESRADKINKLVHPPSAKRTHPAGDAAAAALLSLGHKQPTVGRAFAAASGQDIKAMDISAQRLGEAVRRRLVDRGALQKLFELHEYTIDDFVKGTIEACNATKTVMVRREGEKGARVEVTEPDWRARQEARDAYSRLCGLDALPHADPAAEMMEIVREGAGVLVG